MLQINNKIQRGFGRAARSYDRYSGLHRQIAEELLARIKEGPLPSSVLDVGCGTGYLTGKVSEFFAESQITGIDFSSDMLEMAACQHDDITWVLGDGNDLPFPDDSFDILISNLAYQWAGDLTGAFAEARRVLTPKGTLAITLFGYHTCHELFQSLIEAKAGTLQFNRLPNGPQVRDALVLGGFKMPVVDSEQIIVDFKDMHELITWLKLIGANHLARDGFIGKQTLTKAAAIYRERFACPNGVQATFEVIKAYAQK